MDFSDNSLFTMVHDHNNTAEFYGKSTISYYKGTGLSGGVVEGGKSEYIEHPRSNPNYNQDIDNCVITHDIRSLLLTPLISNNRTIGVLQLINKKPHVDINDDTSKLEHLLGLITSSVMCARNIIEVTDLVVKTKEGIGKL